MRSLKGVPAKTLKAAMRLAEESRRHQLAIDKINRELKELLDGHVKIVGLRNKPAKGANHELSLIRALADGKPMKLKELCEKAYELGARSSNNDLRNPLHAILCRKPEVFRSLGKGYWILESPRTAKKDFLAHART
jgi:hypothetical protein